MADGAIREPSSINTRDRFTAGLRAIRESAGFSIRDLSRRTGIPSGTLGGWFAGRHLPTSNQLNSLGEVLRECGLDENAVGAWLEAARRVRRNESGAKAAAPYPGLRSFDVDDAGLFFGREETTAVMLERLRALRADPGPSGGVLCVVGASGSGKTSLLRAGLAASLRAEGVECQITSPGHHPSAAFDAALGRLGGGCVLVVDQLEEVFTGGLEPDDRARFLDRLVSPPDGVLVVLGLRADFYEAASREGALLPVLRHGQVLLSTLRVHDLRDAVVKPAVAVGATVDDALVELVLADLAPRDAATRAHDAGALPLLSHALLSAWNRASGPRLTVADYRDAGGIDGAISRSAEAAWNALPPADRPTARWLFLRLVNVWDDVALTRRRVSREEIDALDEGNGDVDRVVDDFVEQRLLTATADSVEISHEALLTAWPRLRRWIEDDRSRLRLRRSVTDAAHTWAAADRDPSLLLRGTRLAAATELAADPASPAGLNDLERELVAASDAARRADLDAARRRTNRLRSLLGVVAALALVAGVLAVVSARARSAADRAEQDASTARDLALSRQIAGRAKALAGTDAALAQQLAVVAFRTADTEESRGALIDQSAEPAITRILGVQGPTSLAVSPDGTVIAVSHADDGSVHLYRWEKGGVPTPLGVATPPPAPAGQLAGPQIYAMAFTPDGRTLITAGQPSTVSFWDVTHPEKPRLRDTVPTGFAESTLAMAVSTDGRLAIGGSGDRPLRQFDIADPAAPAPLPSPPGAAQHGEITCLAYTTGGTLLAGTDGGTLLAWPAGGGGSGPLSSSATVAAGHRLNALAIKPHADLVAVGTSDGSVTELALPALTTVRTLSGVTTGAVNVLRFNPDGTRLLTGSSDTTVRQVDPGSGEVLSSLPNPGPVTGVGYGRDGRTVLEAAADGTLRLFSSDPGLPNEASVFNLSWNRTGTLLATAGSTIRLWNFHDPRHPALLSSLAAPANAPRISSTGALSSDGRLLAAGDVGGGVRLWDVSDPAHPKQIGSRTQILTPPRKIHATADLIESVTFSPDGRTLVVSGDDGSVRLVDVSDPAAPRTLSVLRPGNLVLSVAVGPHGRLLSAADANGHGYLWNVGDRAHPTRLGRFSGFKNYVYSTAISPNGRYLALGSADETVRLWRLDASGHPHPLGAPLIGSTGYVYGLAFSPDSRTLATASTDDHVRLYRVGDPHPSRVPRATLGALGGNAFAVSFRPGGKVLLGGGRQSFVAEWSLDPAAYTKRLCRAAGTSITRQEWLIDVPGAPYNPPCT